MKCTKCHMPTLYDNIICELCRSEDQNDYEDYDEEDDEGDWANECSLCTCGAYKTTKEGKVIRVSDCYC